MLLNLLMSFAYAGNWTFPVVHTFDIKSTLGPKSAGGDAMSMIVGSCVVGSDTGCLAADGGLTITSSWPAFTTCTTKYNSTSNLVTVYLNFKTPQDANGFATWPTSWPSYVDCSRSFTAPHPEAGYTHTFRTTLGNDQDQDIRFKAGGFSTTPISLSTGKSLTVDAPFNLEEFAINLPNKTYSGASSTDFVKLYTAATGGSAIDGAFCTVKDAADDYLLVVLDDSITVDLNGATAGRGTFYCRVTGDGTNYAIPFPVTIN